jgi:hypothetical protein
MLLCVIFLFLCKYRLIKLINYPRGRVLQLVRGPQRATHIPHQNSVKISLFPHAYDLPRSSQPLRFDLRNIWQGIQTMKFLIMQFSPPSCYFLPFGSKYLPHHPILFIFCQK